MSLTITPKGKESGAWIIRGGTNPPPAKNGIEVFHGKKSTAQNSPRNSQNAG